MNAEDKKPLTGLAADRALVEWKRTVYEMKELDRDMRMLLAPRHLGLHRRKSAK